MGRNNKTAEALLGGLFKKNPVDKLHIYFDKYGFIVARVRFNPQELDPDAELPVVLKKLSDSQIKREYNRVSRQKDASTSMRSEMTLRKRNNNIQNDPEKPRHCESFSTPDRQMDISPVVDHTTCYVPPPVSHDHPGDCSSVASDTSQALDTQSTEFNDSTNALQQADLLDPVPSMPSLESANDQTDALGSQDSHVSLNTSSSPDPNAASTNVSASQSQRDVPDSVAHHNVEINHQRSAMEDIQDTFGQYLAYLIANPSAGMLPPTPDAPT